MTINKNDKIVTILKTSLAKLKLGAILSSPKVMFLDPSPVPWSTRHGRFVFYEGVAPLA